MAILFFYLSLVLSLVKTIAVKTKSPSEIKFSGPGIYHIHVMGEVCQEIWEYFNGKTEQIMEDNGEVITYLKVQVRDQSELAGIIKLFYDWQHVLLLVKRERQDEEMEVK